MNEAFKGYENVRHRLPRVTRQAACDHRANLESIAEEIDVFLLDAFGVLNIGETAIEHVPERVARLQASGKRVLVVSHAAGVPHDALIDKYKRLGYGFVSIAKPSIVDQSQTTCIFFAIGPSQIA